MADQLLVRMFNVGLGDCIYIRVPDKDTQRHILIDCGNKFNAITALQNAIGSLVAAELPPHPKDPSKKLLDLLVVTHPHEDHHKGFEAEFFEGIKIDNLWLSPAFARLKPDAEKNNLKDLQQSVGRAAEIVNRLRLNEAYRAYPEMYDRYAEMVKDVFDLTKSEAIKMLTTTLPQQNGIEPLYVHQGTAPAKLELFTDRENIKVKVLAPMEDMDKYYLGGVAQALHLSFGDGDTAAMSPGVAEDSVQASQPKNISREDFERLRRGAPSNVLAAAETLGGAVNNLSVVLLLEWHGNRLLFPGDAEWSGQKIEVKPGGNNGSWNVMWDVHKEELSKPLDFLKVGHHGSVNATPWSPPISHGAESTPHPISNVLDQLLPLPEAGQAATARTVVSTNRTKKWPTIPDPDIMAELGRRVANATTYTGDSKIKAGTRQPQRTDQETFQPEHEWIDITFDPK
jgi:beta-lactamase superfamily II metal-dependent hydrolase